MSASKPESRKETVTAEMHRVMTKVTVIASFLAGVLMLFGSVLYLFSGMPIPGKSSLAKVPTPTLSQLLTGREYLNPSAYLGLGLIVLSLTPILRIIVALTYFWHIKSKRNMLAAIGVLAIIVLSIVLAWR
ncbi:MAG TPA: DUF1634 domain-containing protein [Blastocatellia bacterium]|nr:DUF1634 domain-containing protein [Blastocatellia bacterium]